MYTSEDSKKFQYNQLKNISDDKLSSQYDMQKESIDLNQLIRPNKINQVISDANNVNSNKSSTV